eukprot:TRINITY_DN14843_c0_g1_i1.p1 TRINITY_DN14843_c0_g1~~TRINITY_DN14843_c0_g1_i1.p1  ORF type:complete len:1290 (-),score=377.99 TRINITY_DN14843_c0_g1_i1:485-4354(-)
MSHHDDEEEAFFRQHGGGGSHHHNDRDEEEFFNTHKEKHGPPDPAPPVQAAAKKMSVFGRALPALPKGPTPGVGLGKFLKGKATTKPPPAPGGAKMPGAMPPKKSTFTPVPAMTSKPVTADEDSDGEDMDSSDEEEAPQRKAALERQETRVIRGESVARAPPAMRRDVKAEATGDGEEESGEPDIWEEVDEEELARKVRELRDPRAQAQLAAALAAKSAAPKASLMRKGAIQAGASELVDPMGCGSLSLKTLTLGKDTGSQSKAADGLVDKVLYTEPSFSARFYLARIHRDTPVEDLEAGKGALKKDIALRHEQLKKLVKENFDIFISCKNTIDDIHVKIQQMESDREGTGTEKLSESITDCDEVARRAFSPLLERQAQVDRIRSVQGLLQRFRTLFNLPSVVRTFVRKGEYDNAVHEFVKAKTLNMNFPVHQSGILKKVLEEVEKVVQEFKEVLYTQMADPQVELSQVENKIRLLMELEPESDPVWHYLQLEERRMRALLDGAQREADLRLEALQRRVAEHQAAEQRWKQMQFESSQGSEVDLSLLLGEEHLLEEEKDLASEEEADAINARLIRRLTAVLKQQVPRFWKLTLSIFAGRFANFATADGGRDPSGRGANRADEGGTRYSKHSQDEVAVMVLGVLTSYENKVLGAFEQLEKAPEVRPYIRESVAEVASACTALRGRESSPIQAVSALQLLRVEVTRRFVARLCGITRGAAVELAGEEDWVPAPTVQRQGAPYAISYFPIKFRDTMAAALDHVTGVLSRLAEEEGAESRSQGGPDNVFISLRSMYDSVKATFFESFMDFCECLEKMSKSLPQAGTRFKSADQDMDGLPSPDGQSAANEEGEGGAYAGLQVGVQVKSADQRILMLLSNAGFCRTVVVPMLVDKYHHLWVDGLDDDRGGRGRSQGGGLSNEATRLLADLEKHFQDLEATLGDKYIEIKAGHLGMAVIKYLEDGTSWATAPPVKGLRDSALELMHPLVAVHAEVYAGCRPFVERAINMLAEGLMDALNQVAEQHSDLQKLDANAFCQLSLELDYFETVLHTFSTDALSGIVYSLREMLCMRTMEGIEAALADPDSEKALRRRGGGDDEGMGGGMGAFPQSADELKHNAESISADMLPGELKRTKVNVYCFTGRTAGDNFSHSRGYDSHSHTQEPFAVPNTRVPEGALGAPYRPGQGHQGEGPNNRGGYSAPVGRGSIPNSMRGAPGPPAGRGGPGTGQSFGPGPSPGRRGGQSFSGGMSDEDGPPSRGGWTQDGYGGPPAGPGGRGPSLGRLPNRRPSQREEDEM